MTYSIASMTYEEANKKQGGLSKIRARECQTLNEARAIARRIIDVERSTYKCTIFDDNTAGYVTFKPTGQRLKNTMGDEVGEVIKHWVYPNKEGSQIFYYPNYDYKPNKARMKFRKYVVKKDGSLGQGYW